MALRPPSPQNPESVALRGDLLDVAAAPAWGDLRADAVRWRPDHWLLIDGGRITSAVPGDQAPDARYRRVDHRGRLILPGFVDTHVHSPQLDVIGSHGTALLDWLETYTFPAERRWADPAVAEAGSARFLDALLAHGTTAAAVYPTVHKVSAEALFAAADERGMRVIAGPCLMDRNAPDGLRASAEQSARDSADLITRWHGRGRNAFAVTVRFAPTSSPEQLAMAGALCAADPTLYLQTHLAENTDELRWVAELYPEARSYLDVYARAGLLHPRSVLAHGIWLDDADRAALRASGAQIAHCPTSNLFLGSGLFDWPALHAAGVPVSVASDVGGGTSLNLLRNLAAAYQVQAMRGAKPTAWTLLHAATRAPAEALQLGGEIGSFDVGCCADLTVWRCDTTPVMRHRLDLARDLHERLFAWLMLADEHSLHSTWVAGVPRFTHAE